MPTMDSVFFASFDASFGVFSLPCVFSLVEEHATFRKVRNLKKWLSPTSLSLGASKGSRRVIVGYLAASTYSDGDSLGGGRLGNTVSSKNKLLHGYFCFVCRCQWAL